ncbi:MULTISPECIES: sirohydrochlorin chelatase [Mycolicibacterium]|uniref:Sirohydrochlorin chelatase n=1 Tax=Mycolicibacterium austroafricanum TaxID=39687 RepID=A0ABT8HJK6_MYCAO|nr:MULTISPECIES: sirohydrochlorin chelatase [Mycolicibacterium]MDN4520938.1 sirohydrochlorin chelatase [Mycolicibacterium austroafricanum]PQP39110.1 sirohydrochlorin chelatase [Mycolicibacterium austroafricanum]QRZ04733.1 sirohydrochlorin chelatase [Mycolicibacterium austroafricanum]QZT66598.1 sirohydrochlorin chelatase [Mycolicibacterium austroafricanum]QZY44478.1 sirohydrochlorin chelatase [Mycolicibacterium austroafricanum]
MTLILTAHGSADPRSAQTARAIVDCIRRLRPTLDARIAFCEQSSPNLRDELAALRRRQAVVVPLLLADAYHARVDIPEMIAASGADVRQAGVLGEDDRLIHVLRQRLEHAGVSRLDPSVGVIVTAVGSSRPAANVRTATVARELTLTTRWTATTAFATGPHPSPAEAADELRRRGATRLVIAPWFLAHGRITDRVADFAAAQRIPMSAPLGAHRQVAETVLDRFDAALAVHAAA